MLARDAAQRHKRVYAPLRRAMTLAERCAAEPGLLDEWRSRLCAAAYPRCSASRKCRSALPGHESLHRRPNGDAPGSRDKATLAFLITFRIAWLRGPTAAIPKNGGLGFANPPYGLWC